MRFRDQVLFELCADFGLSRPEGPLLVAREAKRLPPKASPSPIHLKQRAAWASFRNAMLGYSQPDSRCLSHRHVQDNFADCHKLILQLTVRFPKRSLPRRLLDLVTRSLLSLLLPASRRGHPIRRRRRRRIEMLGYAKKHLSQLEEGKRARALLVGQVGFGPAI